MDCPNPDCKQRVDGHSHTLYGEDGRGGLVRGENELKTCLGKKVSRKGMIITVTSIVIALLGSGGTFTIYGLEALKKDRAIVTENKENIATVNAELEYLKVMVEENHNNLEDIKHKMDEKHMTKKELKKLMRDAVKEGYR